MPETKEQYFALSRELSLPQRCPLLARCTRRAETLALANGWPLDEAAGRVALKKPVVSVVGAGPSSVGGTTNFNMSGMCPEVNLFETGYAMIGFSGKPTTRGEFDKYRDPQYTIEETGHYSQCAEYAASQAGEKADHRVFNWENGKWLIGTLLTALTVVAAYLFHK